MAPTTVLFCTEPDEPFVQERYNALYQASPPRSWIHHIPLKIEQDPSAPGFWDFWRETLYGYGFNPGDYIVASEMYGAKLAEVCDGVFMPYDLNRTVYNCKATEIRENPAHFWQRMIPEFRRTLRPLRVTIFGAESCGKTTLARNLATWYGAPWLFEWARPYLDAVGVEVTTEKMNAIWHGQLALQRSADYFLDSPVIFQDTDLFSTVGYWDMWDGQTPAGLVKDAIANKSDLYLVAPSNIPFEPDPQRYGGDKRESSDQYWIDLCERYGLNYRVLTHSHPIDRECEADNAVWDELEKKFAPLRYDRKFN